MDFVVLTLFGDRQCQGRRDGFLMRRGGGLDFHGRLWGVGD
jgi:hypothetical protein